jgi:predicted transcriptional regulator
MATAELIDAGLIRDAITLRIASIDDPMVLDVFLTLADKYHKPKPLTAAQLEDIEISRRQIAAGLTIPHEEVMRKFDALYPDDDEESEVIITTAELTDLRSRLIGRIGQAKDAFILQEVESVLDEFEEGDVYELTPEEREDLEERIRDCKAGIGIPHEIVMAEVREWLQTQK